MNLDLIHPEILTVEQLRTRLIQVNARGYLKRRARNERMLSSVSASVAD